MRQFHKALLYTGIAAFITAFLLSMALLTIYSLWHIDELVIPRPDGCFVIEGKGRTVFSSFIPWHVYYTLKAINANPIGEIVVVAQYKNTTFLIRGLTRGGTRLYGMNVDSLGRGEALIGVKLARILRVKTGDVIEITSATGRKGVFRIIGLIHSTSYPTFDYEAVIDIDDAILLSGTKGLNLIITCNEGLARLIGRKFQIEIEGYGYVALILNAANESIMRIRTPWRGILPFGLYRILAFKGGTPCYYNEVFLNEDRTIFIPKNACIVVKQGKGNVAVKAKGVKGSVWVLAVGKDRTIVTYGNRGKALLNLDKGPYVIVVYSQGRFTAIKTVVRGNTTIVVRPMPIKRGVIISPSHVGKGKAILSRALRELFSLALAFLSSTILSITIGIASFTRLICESSRLYVEFLRLNRASKLTIFLLVDLPIVIIIVFSCIFAFYAAYSLIPCLFEAFDVRIFEKPLYLVILSMGKEDHALLITAITLLHVISYVAYRLVRD